MGNKNEEFLETAREDLKQLRKELKRIHEQDVQAWKRKKDALEPELRELADLLDELFDSTSSLSMDADESYQCAICETTLTFDTDVDEAGTITSKLEDHMHQHDPDASRDQLTKYFPEY